MSNDAKTSAPPKRVLLGEIARAHGVRGEVLIRSFCEPPDDVAAFGPLTDETGARTFKVKVRGATAKGLIARIEGVGDKDAADQLRGTGLYVDRDRLPEPDADEFYHADLIGMAVRDPDGNALGTVVAVQNFGAGDLIEVQLPNAKRTEFYPFVERFIPSVDLDARVIIVAIDPPLDPADDKPPSPDTNDAEA